jgi:magnesium transporter
LAAYAILVAYMPLVALVGGNSGAQSLAVVIRSIAVGDLPPGRARRAVRREMTVGMINGVIIAAIAGLIGALTVSLLGDEGAVSPAKMAIIIMVAILVAFFVAGLVGSGIPVVLRRMGQDPALASNIFLTLTVDLVSFGTFLLTASLLL